MPTINQQPNRIIRILTGNPMLVLILFVSAAVVAAFKSTDFSIDASADTLLMRNNRHYIESKEVQQRFQPSEFLLIAYQPKQHSLFSQQTYDDLQAIQGKLQNMDRVESVRSLLNLPLLLPENRSLTADTDFDELTHQQQDYSAETLQETFRHHPVYEDLVINRDQTATAMQVLFKSDEKLSELDEKILHFQQKRLENPLSETDAQNLKKLRTEAETLRQKLDQKRMQEVQFIRKILKPYEVRADLYMGGVHVLGFQLIRIIKNDLIVFGISIAAIICLVLLFLFRRLRWVLVPVLCCACSLICTVGLFAAFGFKTTVISSSFISLQLILTLAVVVHLIVQYRELQAEHTRWDSRKLVRETLIKKAGPCFFAALTTSIGFASLILSNIGPVIDFGWMMVIALIMSTVVSLILFPALLVLFPNKDPSQSPLFLQRMVSGLGRFTLHKPIFVILVTLLIFAAGLMGSLRLSIENSFIGYFRKETQIHRELSFIDRDFGGSTPLNMIYSLPASEANDRVLLSAETVQQMQRIQQRLQQHEGVGKMLAVTTFTDWARQINQDRPITEYELTSIYWLMENEFKDDLLGSYLKPEELQSRFNIRIQDTTPELDRAGLLADIRSDMQQLNIPTDRYKLTGLFVLYQDILQRLFKSQAMTLSVVFIAVMLTFMLIFRSIKIGLIAIIPNLLSTVVVLGTMGWLHISLDLMTITVAAVAMGIAVDDTIHYIHRYREELKHHKAAEAVQRTHDSVGHAILYTSLIIMLGCSLFIFSNFMPSVWFGLFTGLAMLSALLGDLLILPVLLKRFVRKN